MIRLLWIALLAALLLPPVPADAQWPRPRPEPGWRERMRDDISGRYVTQGGDPCSVRREGDGYTFLNEQGSSARFVYAGPNRLEQVEGEWDPSVVCTVRRERGRIVLRFDSPNAPPGYWTSVD
jgi:hypothetical protein